MLLRRGPACCCCCGILFGGDPPSSNGSCVAEGENGGSMISVCVAAARLTESWDENEIDGAKFRSTYKSSSPGLCC